MFQKKTSVLLTIEHAKKILMNAGKFPAGIIVNSFKAAAKKVLENPKETFNLQVSVKELDFLYHLLSGETKLKNPISTRTAKLRATGEIKPTEWIGGNEFHQVKPKQNKFLQRMQEREKYGQQRLFNPDRPWPRNTIERPLTVSEYGKILRTLKPGNSSLYQYIRNQFNSAQRKIHINKYENEAIDKILKAYDKKISNPSKSYDLGNNETAVIGIFKEKNGTYQALTRTKSKDFKTLSGAEKWFLKHGGTAAKKLLNK